MVAVAVAMLATAVAVAVAVAAVIAVATMATQVRAKPETRIPGVAAIIQSLAMITVIMWVVSPAMITVTTSAANRVTITAGAE